MQKYSNFQTQYGGVSRLFTTAGRSVGRKIESCRIETSSLTITEKDIDASAFDSLQAALDCITSGTLGNINLVIPDGNYVETIVLSDTSTVDLKLMGTVEPQFGFGFQEGKTVIGPAEFGSGVSNLTSVGSTITIANSGTAPDLTLLNIQSGDTILIQNDGGTIQRRTISSVTADSITLTSNVTLGATTGAGFVFLPRVHITGSFNTSGHQGKVTLQGIFVSSSDGFGVQSTVAPVFLDQSVIHTVDPEAQLGALFLSGAAIPRSDINDSALFGSRALTVERISGIESQNLTIYVENSTQEGWGIRLNEASTAYVESGHIAGQPNGSIILTNDGSFLDIEATEITVNLPTYPDRALRADLNSAITLHDNSSVELTDPVGTAVHASATNISKLAVCGVVEFIGNGVVAQSAVEAANGSFVISDSSPPIAFTNIAAGTEYKADALTGAAPPVGPGASQAIVLDKI